MMIVQIAIPIALLSLFFGGAVSQLQCGQHSTARSDSLSARIVGGTTAENGEFPWQISLQKPRSQQQYNDWVHFCGGSIISETHILTAAHCVEDKKYGYQPGSLRVVAGTINWRVNNHEPSIQIVPVSRVAVHDGWSRQTGMNDVAVLQLSQPLKLTLQQGRIAVNKVCMPHQGQQFTGNVMSSGWGFMSKYSRVSPDILRKVEIPVVDFPACRQAFSQIIGISENQVCAGIANKGNCMGDSGSPLVKYIDGRATQVGIVSFSIPCAVQGYPDVFTRVSAYMPWVQQQSGVGLAKADEQASNGTVPVVPVVIPEAPHVPEVPEVGVPPVPNTEVPMPPVPGNEVGGFF